MTNPPESHVAGPASPPPEEPSSANPTETPESGSTRCGATVESDTTKDVTEAAPSDRPELAQADNATPSNVSDAQANCATSSDATDSQADAAIAPCDIDAPSESNTSSLDERLDHLTRRLGQLQRAVRNQRIPVILLLDGWEASGKGTLIGKLALALDPRGFRVLTPPSAKEELARLQPLDRFWQQLPEQGEILIVDQSYYTDLWRSLGKKGASSRELDANIASILAFERTLVANGCVLVKCFLDIKRTEQRARYAELTRNSSMAWRIDKQDLHQHRHYRRYRRIIQNILEKTAATGQPTRIVRGRRRKRALLEVLSQLVDALALAVDLRTGSTTPESDPLVRLIPYSFGPNPLDDLGLNQTVSRDVYESKLRQLQSRLRDLEHIVYRERIPVVMLFEGWDAAGKGGSIRRLVAGLDPRGYEVVPVAAPTETERRRHYLWRFARKMPRSGHITLFDRSWYGRVLVERVEGFCSDAAWQRAYSEIAAFEADFVRHGGVLVKFWFQIDKDTQLARFEARQATEDKQWKITEEDWRNRAKWDAYELALVDMLRLTSTDSCPWTVVAANDKLLARLSTLERAIAAIETRLR